MVLRHCLPNALLVTPHTLGSACVCVCNTERKSWIRFANHCLFLSESQIMSFHHSIHCPAAWLAYSGLYGSILVSLAFWVTNNTWNDPSYLGSKLLFKVYWPSPTDQVLGNVPCLVALPLTLSSPELQSKLFLGTVQNPRAWHPTRPTVCNVLGLWALEAVVGVGCSTNCGFATGNCDCL